MSTISQGVESLQAAINTAANTPEQMEFDIYSLGPWSYSKYKSLVRCPFQFFLKYLAKIKVPAELQVKDDPLSAAVGSAAHLVLEEILKGRSVEKAYAASKKKYVLEDKELTEEEWAEHLETLSFNIRSFKERLDAFDAKNKIKRVLTETRAAFTKDFEPTGFFAKDAFVRGVIDLVLLLECSDALIIDHKHGGGEGGIKNYKEQLDWYKVLVNFGIQKVQAVQTGIHFIKKGDIILDNKMSPSSEVDGHLRNLLMMSLEGAVEKAKDIGYFKHVRGPYCKWCEFDNLGCRDGTLKPAEMATRKWIPISTLPSQ